MPYKRRTPRKKRNMGYTRNHLWQLRHGHHYPNRADFGDVTANAEAREAYRVAWEIFREQILADWIREEPDAAGRGGPGTRPYAWWMFDAPELRRRIDGKPHPFDNPERDERIAATEYLCDHGKRTFYGCPNVLCVMDDFEAIYETQAEYLERLGLWLAGERERFDALQQTEPEPTPEPVIDWEYDE